MRSSSLTRLRVGFVLLAAALLAPLALLLRSVEARLEAQRHLRHEIVAERIYDEMERELTALLARESERPSAAYDATQTRIETWAPFVVGYFTRDARGLRVIAREQLSRTRGLRVQHAVARALPVAPVLAPPAARDSAYEGAGAESELSETSNQSAASLGATNLPRTKLSKSGATDLEKKALPQKSPPEAVLRQLNRSAEQRYDQVKGKAKRPAATSPNTDLDGLGSDPLNGL